MVNEVKKVAIENKISGKSVLLLLQIVMIVSVLSQISELEYILRPLMFIGWFGIFICLTISNGFEIQLSKFTWFFIFSYIAYFCYCAILTISGTEHIKSNYLKLLLVPIMVCVVTDMINEKSEKFFQRSIFTYIFATTIFAVYINLKIFTVYDQWVDSTGYLFAQKNSASQILGTAVLLIYCVFLRSPVTNKFLKIGLSCLAIYFVLLCALCKCRAVLLALVCVFIINFFINVKHKLFYLIIAAAIVAFCSQNVTVQKFIYGSLNLNNYDFKNLNEFSSNRIELWKRALDIFNDNALFGVGNYYVDNAYINILTESGIIGFLIIMPVFMCRMICNIKFTEQLNNGLLLFLTLFYLVESLLEAYPPFGPGVSVFMFWFGSEFMTMNDTYKEVNNEYNKNKFSVSNNLSSY